MDLDTAFACGPMAVLYVGERDVYDEACWPKKRKEKKQKKEKKEKKRKAEPSIKICSYDEDHFFPARRTVPYGPLV